MSTINERYEQFKRDVAAKSASGQTALPPSPEPVKPSAQEREVRAGPTSISTTKDAQGNTVTSESTPVVALPNSEVTRRSYDALKSLGPGTATTQKIEERRTEMIAAEVAQKGGVEVRQGSNREAEKANYGALQAATASDKPNSTTHYQVNIEDRLSGGPYHYQVDIGKPEEKNYTEHVQGKIDKPLEVKSPYAFKESRKVSDPEQIKRGTVDYAAEIASTPFDVAEKVGAKGAGAVGKDIRKAVGYDEEKPVASPVGLVTSGIGLGIAKMVGDKEREKNLQESVDYQLGAAKDRPLEFISSAGIDIAPVGGFKKAAATTAVVKQESALIIKEVKPKAGSVAKSILKDDKTKPKEKVIVKQTGAAADFDESLKKITSASEKAGQVTEVVKPATKQDKFDPFSSKGKSKPRRSGEDEPSSPFSEDAGASGQTTVLEQPKETTTTTTTEVVEEAKTEIIPGTDEELAKKLKKDLEQDTAKPETPFVQPKQKPEKEKPVNFGKVRVQEVKETRQDQARKQVGEQLGFKQQEQQKQQSQTARKQTFKQGGGAAAIQITKVSTTPQQKQTITPKPIQITRRQPKQEERQKQGMLPAFQLKTTPAQTAKQEVKQTPFQITKRDTKQTPQQGVRMKLDTPAKVRTTTRMQIIKRTTTRKTVPPVKLDLGGVRGKSEGGYIGPTLGKHLGVKNIAARGLDIKPVTGRGPKLDLSKALGLKPVKKKKGRRIF